jgi:hypothetical protein
MNAKLTVKIMDIVIILLALGLTVFHGFAVHLRLGSTTQVLIQGPNQTWVFPLDAEETIRVKGILEDYTVVRISGGEAWAESSPCDNQLCVGMGRIRASSWRSWVACLPNNVMFMLEGNNDNGQIDATAW